MRKLMALLLALMMLCGTACASGVALYSVPDLNMLMTLPEDFVVLKADTDDSVFDALGISKADLMAFFQANSTYVAILPGDLSYEVDVSMGHNDIETFNDVLDLQLSMMIGMLGQELEGMGQGIVFDRGEVFTSAHNDKYLRLYYSIPQAATFAVQYYTIQNNQAINFRLFTYGVEASAEQLAEVESVINGVTYLNALNFN